jgi:hypothetical protein
MCCDVGDMAIGYVACGAITYCDVGDMAIGYAACGGITHCDVGDMAMGCVACEKWNLNVVYRYGHIDTWKSIGGTYHPEGRYQFSNTKTEIGRRAPTVATRLYDRARYNNPRRCACTFHTREPARSQMSTR